MRLETFKAPCKHILLKKKQKEGLLEKNVFHSTIFIELARRVGVGTVKAQPLNFL